jgi:hypothetical protein
MVKVLETRSLPRRSNSIDKEKNSKISRLRQRTDMAITGTKEDTTTEPLAMKGEEVTTKPATTKTKEATTPDTQRITKRSPTGITRLPKTKKDLAPIKSHQTVKKIPNWRGIQKGRASESQTKRASGGIPSSICGEKGRKRWLSAIMKIAKLLRSKAAE